MRELAHQFFRGLSKSAIACPPWNGLRAGWQKDPVMMPFREAARAGQFPGYAGPADRKAAEVLSKYVVTDMYAKALQGMPAGEAVKMGALTRLPVHA